MKIFQICITLAIGLIFTTVLANGQEKVRTLSSDPPYQNQPIEVVSRDVDGKAIPDNNRVMADQDWLNKLTIGIKNISKRPILSFDIYVYLMKEDGMPGLGYPILFRTFTKHAPHNTAQTWQGEVKLGPLQPGEVIKVRINDHSLRGFGAVILKRQGVENLDRAKLVIRMVYFVDHARWSYGQESRPDPNNPGKRIRVDQPEPIK